MDGADHEDRPDEERSTATAGDGSTDEETGGFIFGTEVAETDADDGDATSASADEPTAVEPSTESESDGSRASHADGQRITVDLADDEPESEPPDREPPTGEDGPTPGDNAVRNWTMLLACLASVSFVTGLVAGASGASPDAVLGVTGLGVGFLVVLVLARTRYPELIDALSSGWAEHRRYTYLATALFAGGIVLGALLLAAGVDLLEEIVQLLEEEFAEDADGEFDLTATFFILNNTQPFVLSIVGALTLGLLTAFIMIVNGVIVGNLSAVMTNVVGLDYVIVGLTPHGIFELAALFIAAGVGFRLIHRAGKRVAGTRDAVLTKPYVTRTVALIAFAWLVLVLAAFVEAYVTPELLEALFAERLADLEEEPTIP